MHATICQCCGLPMNVSTAHNPNMCADCDSLAFDDSPIVLAEKTAAGHSKIVRSSNDAVPRVIEFTCEITFE
jgi:hypothetical protein